MSMQPIQRFPNGMISPSKLSCYDKAVEMPVELASPTLPTATTVYGKK
jgi:hypothetical protein